jgi:starvation-inducible outer membrane lipoprotein
MVAKRFKRSAICAFCLTAGFVLSGCANVAPTQRGVLARPDMQFDHDLAQVKIVEHTYASKEAAAGGRAIGGGGCGCGG